MLKTIRSRIHEFLPVDAQNAIIRICNSALISDNNAKVEKILKVLDDYQVSYHELGPGTNRLAVLIDNYVFKIAMDKWGKQDNINEFTVSKELQPFVVRTYEVDESHVFSVCEYVTVISRDEFIEKTEEIRDILAELSQDYLLGDVGTVPKNFCNWGYRDDGQITILDYAYVYRVKGDELLCTNDQEFLEYDMNFHNLICPRCRAKYSFMDVRRRISMDEEQKENQLAKDLAFEARGSIQQVKERYIEPEAKASRSLYNRNDNLKEDKDMTRDNMYPEYDDELSYEDELDKLLAKRKLYSNDSVYENIDHGSVEEKEEKLIVEVQRESAHGSSHVRIEQRGEIDDNEVQELVDKVEEIAREAEETKTAVLNPVIQHDEEELHKTIEEEDTNFDRTTRTYNEDGSVTTEREYVNQEDNFFEAGHDITIQRDEDKISEHVHVHADEEGVRVERVEKTVTVHPSDEPEDVTPEPDQIEETKEEVVEENRSTLRIIPAKTEIQISDTEVHIDEDTTVHTRVSIETDDSTVADELRRELLNELAGDDDTEFNEEFDHLYDNDQDARRNRKGGKNQWV